MVAGLRHTTSMTCSTLDKSGVMPHELRHTYVLGNESTTQLVVQNATIPNTAATRDSADTAKHMTVSSVHVIHWTLATCESSVVRNNNREARSQPRHRTRDPQSLRAVVILLVLCSRRSVLPVVYSTAQCSTG